MSKGLVPFDFYVDGGERYAGSALFSLKRRKIVSSYCAIDELEFRWAELMRQYERDFINGNEPLRICMSFSGEE